MIAGEMRKVSEDNFGIKSTSDFDKNDDMYVRSQADNTDSVAISKKDSSKSNLSASSVIRHSLQQLSSESRNAACGWLSIQNMLWSSRTLWHSPATLTNLIINLVTFCSNVRPRLEEEEDQFTNDHLQYLERHDRVRYSDFALGIPAKWHSCRHPDHCYCVHVCVHNELLALAGRRQRHELLRYDEQVLPNVWLVRLDGLLHH